MEYYSWDIVEKQLEKELGRGWNRSPNVGKTYYLCFKLLVERIGELEKKVDGYEEPKRRGRPSKAKAS